MRIRLVLIALCMILVSLSLSIAAEKISADQIVVDGKPPITMNAVHCHMRLIEFVLNTRLTTAQKDAFLDAIKTECAQMPESDRQSFLSALELADSMEQMEDAGHDAVKFVLQKDFEETAVGTPGDPAAALYLKIKTQITEPEIKIQSEVITRQSFAALVEYLQFVANPDKPVKFSDASKSSIKKLLEESYLKLNETEQGMLDEFELTWFMIRGGWQNTVNSEKKDAALKAMQALKLSAEPALDLKTLKACLSADIYGDLLDEAAQLGFEPNEWSVGQNLPVR